MFNENSYMRTLVAVLDQEVLEQESRAYRGTGGESKGCHGSGFRPAFFDSETGICYLSRYANGQPAPIHMLEGLPEEVVTERSLDGSVLKIKQTVQSGFVKSELFYTREETASLVA